MYHECKCHYLYQYNCIPLLYLIRLWVGRWKSCRRAGWLTNCVRQVKRSHHVSQRSLHSGEFRTRWRSHVFGFCESKKTDDITILVPGISMKPHIFYRCTCCAELLCLLRQKWNLLQRSKSMEEQKHMSFCCRSLHDQFVFGRISYQMQLSAQGGQE